MFSTVRRLLLIYAKSPTLWLQVDFSLATKLQAGEYLDGKDAGWYAQEVSQVRHVPAKGRQSCDRL
ncbi:hypothetical protein BDZ97DRAFT_1869294 [Flammula alnicola]|nr:hypothetical protein BDZ97DRAFT_1869294 [Flammula alnicola]